MADSLAIKPETILVVDDTELVVERIVEILNAANFVVLQANSALSALSLAASHAGRIDLLLSDLQMPGMSGPDLGAALKRLRPDIHVMLMSAFTGGDLLVLNYGWAFIDKPSVQLKLVEMINVVLHTANKSQGSHQYDTRLESGRE